MSGVDPVAAARLRIEVKTWDDMTRGSRVAYKGAEKELLAAGVLTGDLLELLGDRKVRQVIRGDYGNVYTLRRLNGRTIWLEIIAYDDRKDPTVDISGHYRQSWQAAGEQVAGWLRSKGLQPITKGS